MPRLRARTCHRDGLHPSRHPAARARQYDRQRATTETVMAEGSVRAGQLAERSGTSLVTVHRDLDELESRGILRQSRQQQPRRQPAWPNPATSTGQRSRPPKRMRASRGITLLGLGGPYCNWRSAFPGPMTTQEISRLCADILIVSTSAITNDVTEQQFLETVDTKRAVFEAANKRILLAGHTKFEHRALHALVPLKDFGMAIAEMTICRITDQMRDRPDRTTKACR